MNFSLGIKPFNDFWLSCGYNILFSILSAAESSYRLAALMNDYSYEASEDETPTGTKYSRILLNPMVSFQEKYLLDIASPQELNFKNEKNYIELLKDLIKKNEIIIAGVDLFYWIPNSMCWNKYHWEHYSLINGFDEEKNVFYVLDADDIGFNEFEIPTDRFLTAIQHSPLEPHGYIYKIKNNIEQFKLDMNEVADNARRLKNNLEAIKHMSMYGLRDVDFEAGHMCDLNAMQIYQVVNRQIANQLLFRAIQEELHNYEFFDNLIKCCQELQEGWKLVKNILVKAYIKKDRKSILAEIDERLKFLLNKEYEMWDTFLSFTEM